MLDQYRIAINNALYLHHEMIHKTGNTIRVQHMENAITFTPEHHTKQLMQIKEYNKDINDHFETLLHSLSHTYKKTRLNLIANNVNEPKN